MMSHHFRIWWLVFSQLLFLQFFNTFWSLFIEWIPSQNLINDDVSFCFTAIYTLWNNMKKIEHKSMPEEYLKPWLPLKRFFKLILKSLQNFNFMVSSELSFSISVWKVLKCLIIVFITDCLNNGNLCYSFWVSYVVLLLKQYWFSTFPGISCFYILLY